MPARRWRGGWTLGPQKDWLRAYDRRSVRRRARQLEQRQRRALREQGQRLLERAGRLLAPRNDEGPLPRID